MNGIIVLVDDIEKNGSVKAAARKENKQKIRCSEMGFGLVSGHSID